MRGQQPVCEVSVRLRRLLFRWVLVGERLVQFGDVGSVGMGSELSRVQRCAILEIGC